MRPFFQTFFRSAVDLLRSALCWMKRYPHICAGAFLVVLFLWVPSAAHADAIQTVTAYVLSAITKLLSIVVNFLGVIFTYLVDILLGFLRYNDFGRAAPVKIGWVVIRDICNMFFIVVLLISAFGTIIPYDNSLRYNNVLPKLLLMAILINFSKTIIQVGIDASQVVMLTFVNAFQAVGAGNFVETFKMNELLRARTEGFNTSEAQFDATTQVFISYLLAMMLLIIANGVMIIMIAYVLFRIIGLWIALIFSPAAFFITAIPSSLQSGLGSMSGKYWGRLSAMLTGGPTIAFFIYLTFAILQSPDLAANADKGAASQLGLYTSTSNPASTSLQQNFLTRVGTTDSVAAFIVGVAMMLFGLEAAMQVSGEVNETLGGFASNIGNASKSLAKGAATAAVASPWIATRFGYRWLDRKADITGFASRQALRTVGRVPIVGRYTRGILAKGMTMRRNEAEAEAKENKALMEGMSNDQKRLYTSTFSSGNNPITRVVTGNLAEQKSRQAMDLELASEEVFKQDLKRVSDEMEDTLERINNKNKANKDFKGHIMTQEQIEREAEIYAVEQGRRRQAERLESADQIAKRDRDIPTRMQIKAMRKTDPLFEKSMDKTRTKVREALSRPDKASNWSDVAKADGRVLMEMLVSSGAVHQADDGSLTMANEAEFASLLNRFRKDATLVGNLKVMAGQIRNSPGTRTRDQLEHSAVMTNNNGEQNLYTRADAPLNLIGRAADWVHPWLGQKFGDFNFQQERVASLFGEGENLHYATLDLNRQNQAGVEIVNDRLQTSTEHILQNALSGAIDPDQLRDYFEADGSMIDFRVLATKNASGQDLDPTKDQAEINTRAANIDTALRAMLADVVRDASAPGVTFADMNRILLPFMNIIDSLGQQGVSTDVAEQVVLAATNGNFGRILEDKQFFGLMNERYRDLSVKLIEQIHSLSDAYAKNRMPVPPGLMNIIEGVLQKARDRGRRNEVPSMIIRAAENPRVEPRS